VVEQVRPVGYAYPPGYYQQPRGMGVGGAMMAGAAMGTMVGMEMAMDRNRYDHRGGVVVVNDRHGHGYNHRGHTDINVHKNIDVSRHNGHIDVHKSTHIDVNHHGRGHGGAHVNKHTNINIGGGGGHHHGGHHRR